MSGNLVDGSRTWRVYVPSSYRESVAVPLVVSTHGWGGDGSQEERSTGLNNQADKSGFIVVYPDGLGDNSGRGSWGSWNAVGSTQSPGPQGKTCSVNLPSYCYNSCNGCGEGLGCDWTTCKNDVTPSGIGKNNANGFLPSLYDYIEDNFCIDTAREYHTGFSNGGMMTFQMGVSVGTRLAGIVPVAGSMHRGFKDSPTGCVPILNLIGTNDRTVPCCKEESNDGWFYTPAATLLGDWAPQCGGSSTKKTTYATPYDGTNGLKCEQFGDSRVVNCQWTGGHTWPSFNGGLVMYFLNQQSNAKHLGHGLTTDMDPTTFTQAEPLTDVMALPIHTTITTEDKFIGMPLRLAQQKNTTAKAHYGNPSRIRGCRKDEDVLALPGGAVCAPKIATARDGTPACILGGQEFNAKNGCPTDSSGAQSGSVLAWPTCMGADVNSYHCVLTCGPCREADGEDCTAAADAACPTGAKCVVGLNRQAHYGTCMYPSKLDANLANNTVGVVSV